MAVKVSQLPALSAVASDDYLATLDTSASALKKATVSNIVAAGPGATTAVSGLMSASDKIKLDGVAQGAEVNQNAFSNVKVGSTTIQADSKTDTLTLTQGDNVTLTPNASSDSVTISSSDQKVLYGTCSTAADTADKKVVLSGATLTDAEYASLPVGTFLVVKFTVSNTASNCTLSIVDNAASPTKYTTPASFYYSASVYTGSGTNVCGYADRYNQYMWDGTYWVWCGRGLDSDTTYSAMSQSELVTGTARTLRTVRADYLKAGIEDIITQDAWATKNTTAITATSESHADLNDYKTPGNYSSLSSSVSQYIDNAPTTSAGFNLIVIRLINRDDRIRQIAIINASSAIYTRHCSGDDWTSWVNIAQDTTYGDMSQSELVTGTATTQRSVRADHLNPAIRELINSYGWGTQGATPISGTSAAHYDLNTLKTPGNYTCTSTANSAYIDNKPTGSTNRAFNLIVIKCLNTVTYIRQIAWTYDDTTLYVRYSKDAGSTWSSWTNLDRPGNYYGTCTTVAATAEKVVTISDDQNFVLRPGAQITVKYTYTNTAENPTLKVNSELGKSIWYSTYQVTTSSLNTGGYADRNITYIYDGTYWVWLSWGSDSNTTYSAMSASEMITGTATTSRTIRADYFRTAERQLAFMIDKMEAITATSSAHVDLNTYTNAGNFSANNSNSTYVDNQPRTPGTGFNLVVIKGISSSNYARQLLWYYDSDDLFVRSKSGSSASYADWHLIAESSKPVYRPNLAITSTSSNWVRIQIPKLNQTYAMTYPFTIKFTVTTHETTNYTPQSAEVTLSAVLDSGWTGPKAIVKYSNYNISPDNKDSFIGPLTIRVVDSTNSIYVQPSTSSGYSVVVDEIICTGASADITTPDYYGTNLSTVPGAGVPTSYLSVPIDIVPHMNRANGVSVIAHTNFTKPTWAGAYGDTILEVFKIDEVSLAKGATSYIDVPYGAATSGESSVPLVLDCQVWGGAAGGNYPLKINYITTAAGAGPVVRINFTQDAYDYTISSVGVHIKYTKISD